jgi:hypothetical protein
VARVSEYHRIVRELAASDPCGSDELVRFDSCVFCGAEREWSALAVVEHQPACLFARADRINRRSWLSRLRAWLFSPPPDGYLWERER